MSFTDYPTFISHVAGFTWDANDFTWMKDKVAFQGFNPAVIAKEAVLKFGEKPTAQLAIIGALRGNNIRNFGDIEINCTGTVTGIKKLSDLVSGGHLIGEGITKLQDRGQTILNLTRIASAIPTAPVRAFYEWHKAKPHEADLVLTRFNVPKLAPYLQYQSAAALDLRPQTRLLHIEWSKAFTAAINGKFNLAIYNAQMLNTSLYKGDVAVENILDAAEQFAKTP